MVRLWLGLILVLSATASGTPVLAAFDRIWATARDHIYPAERAARHFTTGTYRRLRHRAAGLSTLEALADEVVNPFLKSLGVSHTELLTEAHPDYYFLRSLFSTRRITEPAVFHIGMQTRPWGRHHVIRAVLDGYPAQKAGLRRGDVLIRADGRPFHPVRSFAGKPHPVRLELSRNGRRVIRRVRPVEEALPESFRRAMIHSVSVTTAGSRRLGYLRLWVGTHDDILRDYKALLAGPLRKVDGLVLDLRDGFGGAWYEHLDPFFADRRDFFTSTWVDRDGNLADFPPPPASPHRVFTGPMAVLINEGVRSGKEAVAYQLRKSSRAHLVGEPTGGAFCAGRGFFSDEDSGYLLYLAVAELRLNGETIEGVGIAPHAHVPYPLNVSLPEDPQRRRAMEWLREAVGATDRSG